MEKARFSIWGEKQVFGFNSLSRFTFGEATFALGKEGGVERECWKTLPR